MLTSAPANRQGRNGVVLLGGLCCLGLLLLSIATLIVIALIPIYLPRRDAGQGQYINGPQQQVTYPLPAGSNFSTGSLTQGQRDLIASQYQTMINNNPTTAGSAISLPSATINSSAAKKRKRQAVRFRQFLTCVYQIRFRRGISRRRRNQITIIIIEILDISLSNFDFLLITGSSGQGGVVVPTAATNPATSISSTSSTNPSSSSASSLVGGIVTGYGPVGATCPNGPVVVPATGLYPDEAAWLQQRAPVAEASLRTWLTGIGLNANDYSASTVLPRVGMALSGGGYRALLTGAGVIQAFDGREEATRTSFSGLLQGITYQAGTSGGGWLVTSFAANNYPTISALRDSLWIQRFQYFLITPNPVQPDYDLVAIAQIIAKRDASFRVTAADVWSRLLAFQLIQSPNGGPNVTYDQITSTDAFRSFTLPFPIVTTIEFDAGMCLPGLNASQYEFTPYSFGSWDDGIRAFTPIRFLGTRYNNGQLPANGQCVIGYDNAGFVLGTSSFLFNAVECTVLPDGTLQLVPDTQNTTFGIATTINSITQRILNRQETLTTDDALSAVYPNPFQGYAPSTKVSSFPELNFVDGGETHQNIPLWPLIQLARQVNVIFASDNSADTAENFPNGTQLMATYSQALVVGLPFPFIPDVATFINLGLNVRPTFFGCNETNVPLVIYLPNTNISFASGVATFTPTYSEAVTRGLIQNGLDVATQSNSAQWARCVACAIARRIEGLYGPTTSTECRNCFDTYCYRLP